MIYDIIGDIHGQADKLIGLLEQLGYILMMGDQGNYYQPPPNHRAIFIGDLIDRGEQQLQTLEIVFAMLDANVADCIMGNHEYNALAYATLNAQTNDGCYLRTHTEEHYRQHQAFLAEAPFGSDTHQHWLNRLYELPLWIETEHACFVHACWDVDSMQMLQPYLTAGNPLAPHLTAKGLQQTATKNTPAYTALERILKGIETPLPNGIFMTDKDGSKRHNVRIKWWLDNLNNRPIHEVARAPQSGMEQIPTDAIANNISFNLQTTKPIFIGHYWLNSTPTPLSNQVICTDYSAAIDSGYLTCYQFDTDNPTPLSAKNFVQFNHHQPSKQIGKQVTTKQ